MIMVCFRPGLRVGELVSLRWDQINLDEALIAVRRDKKGRNTEHPIPGDELRALRRLKREQRSGSSFVFMTERGGPMTDRAFRLLLGMAGEVANLSFPVHPHMLRHAAGYKLERRDAPTLERVLPGKPSKACSSGSTSERRDGRTRTPPRTQSATSAAYAGTTSSPAPTADNAPSA